MAKNNEKLGRWIRIAIYIGTILVSVAVAYATLRERVNTNRGRLDTVEQKSDSNQTAIVEMKTDIKYIKEAVKRIESKFE